MTHDLPHKARRGGAYVRVSLDSPADHTSASERWRTTVHDRGNQAEQSLTKGADSRPSRQRLQRRGVPGDAQEWPHPRHGGVHDHAEKDDEPEQPSSGRPLHAQRGGGVTMGLGTPRPRTACE